MTGDLEWPGRKVRHPPLTRPGMTYAEAKALVDSGECDGLGLLVDDRLRAEVSDADLKAVQAAGATLFDALGRELYWNARGSLIPVDPSFTPGVRTPGDA